MRVCDEKRGAAVQECGRCIRLYGYVRWRFPVPQVPARMHNKVYTYYCTSQSKSYAGPCTHGIKCDKVSLPVNCHIPQHIDPCRRLLLFRLCVHYTTHRFWTGWWELEEIYILHFPPLPFSPLPLSRLSVCVCVRGPYETRPTQHGGDCIDTKFDIVCPSFFSLLFFGNTIALRSPLLYITPFRFSSEAAEMISFRRMKRTRKPVKTVWSVMRIRCTAMNDDDNRVTWCF